MVMPNVVNRFYKPQTTIVDPHLLQDLGWRVRYHTITLGLTGTIYNDSIACLRELQLSHSAQEQTVRSWVHYDVESYAWLGHAASAIR